LTAPSFAAVDLGAESGRVIVGSLGDDRLELQEIHRFPNGGITEGISLYWDADTLWSEIKSGMRRAGLQFGSRLQCMGVDAWGVDFGLLDAQGHLIDNPYHYRDVRTDGMLEALLEIVSREEVYAQTGIQFIQFNSLCQLFAMKQTQDPVLGKAKTFLNIPDLFNFFLTGEKVNEFTVSSTTQCLNPIQKTWAVNLLTRLGIPTHIFGEIVDPGTPLGKLRPELAVEIGLPDLTVVASAGHDTASAVAAVPVSAPEYLYLSSGTWSLMGVELDRPMIEIASLHANMTHEGGVDKKIRFLKNLVGLWLVQECRRVWSRAGAHYSYTELTDMAAIAPAFGPLIVPADRSFHAPQDMPSAIQEFCKVSGQPVPETKGEILRCALESLALEYRSTAGQISRLTNKTYPVLHIIGGGAQNRLLNQLAANATGCTVIAGPVEATAIGNILVQAVALGELSSIAEGRALVRGSFDVETYQPQEPAAWEEAYRRYNNLKESRSNQEEA
jgi:rhamnulokinase